MISVGFVGLTPRRLNAAPFGIRVIDDATGRGIPLVILESSLSTQHVTDSNGWVAFDEPVAANHEIFFKPLSDGYEFKAPDLAMGGAVLKVTPGSSATLSMHRDMIAERLYRITGAGVYKDSIALGEKAPTESPLLNAGVIGQDSALCAVYNDKLFWVWGDTSRMGHPLSANFRSTAAFSDLPYSGGLQANQGINLHYLTKDDFVKPMMPLRAGQNAVYWLSCLMNVPDAHQGEHLLAWWNRITMPGMKTVERGIVEFNPEKGEFQGLADYPTTAALQPGGHVTHVATPEGKYVYFTSGDGQFRVQDDYTSAANPANYEALTCLDNDGPFSTATARVRRDGKGRVMYRWAKGAEPTGAAQQRQLLEAGQLHEYECLFQPVDASTGKPFLPHGCHIAWNGHRQCYTMVVSQLMGTSMLGELWYLEADRPEGPWVKAVKVLTHHNYTFYNPLQHPELAPDDQFLYFEGTYTKTFSTAEVATPYYDYNQVMYRIDVDDPRLKPVRTVPEVADKVNLIIE